MILELRKNSSAGGFVRNVFTLLGGTAVAQIIPLLAAPFLTRMYSPEQFGLFALLMAVANPLSVIISGRYEQAIVLPKENNEAMNLVMLSLIVTLILSVISLPGLFFAYHFLPDKFYPELFYELIFIIPILILAIGVWQSVNFWLIRQSEYKRMAVNKIVQMTVIALMSIVFGKLATELGLVWGYLMGWIMVALLSLVHLSHSGFAFIHIKKNKVIEVARKYKEFILFNSFPSLLNTAALSIPVFIIAQNYSQADTGHFNLCRQLLFLPSSFIATAVAQVYYQRVTAQKHEEQKLTGEFLMLVKILSLFAILMLVVLVLFGPVLFEIFFGVEWRTSGEYARILSFSVCTQFVVIPLTVTFSALQKVKVSSIWQLIYFGSILIPSCIRFSSIHIFLIALTVVESLFYLSYYFRIYSMIKLHDNKSPTGT